MNTSQREVEVQVFAGARAAIGADRISVIVDANATVRELRTALREKYPSLATLIAASRFAAATAFVDEEQSLSDIVDVAWIPPVSGG